MAADQDHATSTRGSQVFSPALCGRETCAAPSTKPLPRQEARRALEAAGNCIPMSGQPASLWAWASGDKLFAGGVVRASQGSHMPPALWGAGHRPPQQPDAPGPVWGSRHFLQDTGPPGCFPCCPRLLLSAKVKCSRPVSARTQAALSFWPGHCGLDWTSGLRQPPQPGIRGPWNSETRRAGTWDRPLSACACQVTASLAWPAWHHPHHRGFPRATPGPGHARASVARPSLLWIREREAGGAVPMKPGRWERDGSPHALPIMCALDWQRHPACSVEVGPAELGGGGGPRDCFILQMEKLRPWEGWECGHAVA